MLHSITKSLLVTSKKKFIQTSTYVCMRRWYDIFRQRSSMKNFIYLFIFYYFFMIHQLIFSCFSSYCAFTILYQCTYIRQHIHNFFVIILIFGRKKKIFFSPTFICQIIGQNRYLLQRAMHTLPTISIRNVNIVSHFMYKFKIIEKFN